jgi:nucleoside-diphosphate-sugar epimerase
MKVLVIGADGFVGGNVYRELLTDSTLEVVSAGRNNQVDIVVDLLDRDSVVGMLGKSNPDVVVNCAGIVANNETASMNVRFCENIFEAIIAQQQPYPRVVITGSASEYGIVEGVDPVNEDDDLNGSNDYAQSKINEVKTAQNYAKEHGIGLTVARVFNPIGPGMGEKFLISSLLRQIQAIKAGEQDDISVSRLDSMRDYIDIRDVARAYHAIVLRGNEEQIVVNVGSGKSTTNGELIDSLLDLVELNNKPTIIETQSEPEPNYAACADISRIKAVFGWEPSYELSTSMEDIVNGQSE